MTNSHNEKKLLSLGAGLSGMPIGIFALANVYFDPNSLKLFYIPCFCVGFGMLLKGYYHYMNSPIQIDNFSQEDNL